MEDLEKVIGEGRALYLSFDSSSRQLGAQSWSAELVSLTYGEDGPEEGEQLASAVLVRAHRWDSDWWDSFDAESSDLAEVGEAFRDMDLIETLDEGATFADSIVVLDFVGVPREKRGSQLSHALARGIAYIFRNDIVALIPDANGVDEAGRVVSDRMKEAGLRSHWERGGFITVPGTSVMMLPLSVRP
ncbi:hypothetical protein [Microbacterium sp. P04]|uniref:hypothetical protein n=1 Tax=Microbacterium sp. P04 TaxID=3366947 RepID=UPI0037452B71